MTKVYTFQRSWNYVLWLLSRKAYTKHQLRERLQKKQASPDVIEQVMEKLESMHIVDDERFAEQYIHSRQSKKGKLKLKQELFQKGVDETTVTETLEQLSDEQQVASALKLLEKNTAKFQKVDFRQRYTKAYAFLARRGFSGESIRQALEEFKLEES